MDAVTSNYSTLFGIAGVVLFLLAGVGSFLLRTPVRLPVANPQWRTKSTPRQPLPIAPPVVIPPKRTMRRPTRTQQARYQRAIRQLRRENRMLMLLVLSKPQV